MMSDYRATIFLPQTTFAMKGNLPSLEPKILERWQKLNLYTQLRQQSKGRRKFILHLGPPYANGHLHIGHALNGILKDFVGRCYQMLGFDVPVVPGWDCHGLPIEWKIEEKYRKAHQHKDDVPLEEFRAECRAFAEHWLNVQRQEFIRLGIQADWDHPYMTMAKEAEARIVEKLFAFLENGSLYKGVKPVMWSVVEKTALAEAEIEYQDHQSNAIVVRFPIQKSVRPSLMGASILIWTTTPWSLPGNRAIAYGKDIEYVLVKIQKVGGGSLAQVQEKVVVAEALLERLAIQLNITAYEVLEKLTGDHLKGTYCRHPLASVGYVHPVPLLPGAHVTVEAGTGLVHIAPSHGPEDFDIGKTYQLEVPDTIADDGYFREWVPVVGGEHVFKADTKLIEALKAEGQLVHHDKITHSYPHSWRSKAPLIYRATPQWFISMEKTGLRQTALNAIPEIAWFPPQAENRLTSMVHNRPDWCLSRQRAWGVPLPLFIEKASGNVLNDQEVNSRIIEIFRQEGCEAWFQRDIQDFLGSRYHAEDYEQVRDILDVWFESGASQGYVLEARPDLAFPADVYLEGSDQHRGWFQSSLLIGCGTRGCAPFKAVITHGFVLDEHGRKMSKSLGNVVVPQTIIEKSGAEILRLWVAFADYREDCRIGPEILKHLEDIYRRFRNTLRYLLGALKGYTEQEAVTFGEMPELEQWVLHRVAEIDQLHRDCIAQYDFLTLMSELHNFCAVDLSAFYFDIRKDSLYCDAPQALKRRAARTVFHIVCDRLLRWLAPFLCFTTDEAWLAYYGEEGGSVHLQLFAPLQKEWLNPALAEKMISLRGHRRLITGALEKARAAGLIGSSLQAQVKIFDPQGLLSPLVDYAELAIVSGVQLVKERIDTEGFTLPDMPDVAVQVFVAEGQKCQRCWKVLPEVGSHKRYVDLCLRCCEVVTNDLAEREKIVTDDQTERKENAANDHVERKGE
jgi:isoleucyl-tRNA synthetase